MEGIRKLYTGDFNTMSQDEQPDGSIIITLSKRGENVAYRFRVRDLYGEHEEVLEHEVISHKTPEHISRRMREAKEHVAADQYQPG